MALILVAGFSFLAGKCFTHSKKNSEYVDALATTVNLSSDRWNEIQLLTVLYEASLQDKETAKFKYILAVSLMFRDDIRLRDVYKNDYGLNTGTYSTNNAVIESLKKHGFKECANLEGADLVHCNLDVLKNYPYKPINALTRFAGTYILGGLPATGKTEISKHLSSSLGAVHIRIDTIEQELKYFGLKKLYDEGYKIAFAIALENLKNGLSVVADSTNPILKSREAWISVANKALSPFTEIEVICSSENEHKERVETRQPDTPNLLLPSWESVSSRDYHPWKTIRIVIDTAGKTPEQSEIELSELLRRSYET